MHTIRTCIDEYVSGYTYIEFYAYICNYIKILIRSGAGGSHLAIAFFLLGWPNLLIFADLQLPLLFLSSRLLSFNFSDPLLPKPPKITKDGPAPPCWKPVVSSKAVSFAVGEALEGERKDILKISRDSHHSRSDRLLQAQVWRGFWFRFQMKISGWHAGLGHLKEIQPPNTPPP